MIVILFDFAADGWCLCINIYPRYTELYGCSLCHKPKHVRADSEAECYYATLDNALQCYLLCINVSHFFDCTSVRPIDVDCTNPLAKPIKPHSTHNDLTQDTKTSFIIISFWQFVVEGSVIGGQKKRAISPYSLMQVFSSQISDKTLTLGDRRRDAISLYSLLKHKPASFQVTLMNRDLQLITDFCIVPGGNNFLCVPVFNYLLEWDVYPTFPLLC